MKNHSAARLVAFALALAAREHTAIGLPFGVLVPESCWRLP